MRKMNIVLLLLLLLHCRVSKTRPYLVFGLSSVLLIVQRRRRIGFDPLQIRDVTTKLSNYRRSCCKLDIYRLFVCSFPFYSVNDAGRRIKGRD